MCCRNSSSCTMWRVISWSAYRRMKWMWTTSNSCDRTSMHRNQKSLEVGGISSWATVRMTLVHRTSFKKGYTLIWMCELFIVCKHLPTVPPCTACDEMCDPIKGKSYAQELLKLLHLTTTRLRRLYACNADEWMNLFAWQKQSVKQEHRGTITACAYQCPGQQLYKFTKLKASEYKTCDGEVRNYVRWHGYMNIFNSWIDEIVQDGITKV